MTPIRWIYRSYGPERVLAATLTVDADGRVRIGSEGPDFKSVMELIGHGVYSNVDRRVVERDEGAHYIAAVEQMFYSSSMWIVDGVPPNAED